MLYAQLILLFLTSALISRGKFIHINDKGQFKPHRSVSKSFT